MPSFEESRFDLHEQGVTRIGEDSVSEMAVQPHGRSVGFKKNGGDFPIVWPVDLLENEIILGDLARAPRTAAVGDEGR